MRMRAIVAKRAILFQTTWQELTPVRQPGHRARAHDRSQFAGEEPPS
jgi:hypothetical protein